MDSPNKIRRAIHKLGWRTEITNGNHIRCTHPDAAFPVITGATPSDRRAWKGLLSTMRKALAPTKAVVSADSEAV